MGKCIQLKHKIQNLDGQPHTIETKYTKSGWTKTYK